MKLFVLLSRIPYPLEKGDKLRAFHQIRLLSKQHEIILCCLSDVTPHPKAKEVLGQYCHQVEFIPLKKWLIPIRMFRSLFSSKPVQVHYFYQNQAQRKINEIIKNSQPDHIYCQLIRCSEYVKNIFNIKKTLDYMDAFNKGVERRQKNAPFYLKPIFKLEASRLVRYENLIYEYFDERTIISKQDQYLIYHSTRNDIHIIPNGVDSEYFKPSSGTQEYDLLFTGNMSYPPNVDGVLFLCKEILPLLKKDNPKIKILIAGANPKQEIKDLDNDNVTVSGWIEDIRDAYSNAKIFVAPMRIGTGLQNKILEALSMGLPVVTTSLANNAIGAKNGSEITVVEQVDQIAKAITELLSDEQARFDFSSKGRDFVVNEFSWESTVDKLNSVFES